MTYIFDVFTEPRDGSRLSGNVEYRDRDNYGFSQGPVFGLQLLMDAWREGGDFGAGAVSEATKAEFTELFEIFLGRQIRVDEEGYLLKEGSTEVRIPRVKAEDFHKGELGRSRGYSDGVHYVTLVPRPEEFARRTAEIIVSWEIEEDDSGSADFTLEVSDPRYLEHFSKSAYFQTAFTGHLPRR
ncbi:hypothetical protein HUT18_17125 [Streptomyces sp. NA04227]|uniref:hypothetical protein n=1 Tax=Streptomyces sp. NA04227 TaxID=2742136 RepID=UPI001591C9C2|nr:hypothetical protein [Streptomyces sp. NA04227]QKW07852.1 hypothetical protein HUT18_17125 [Streptomyces sp. NA04227]